MSQTKDYSHASVLIVGAGPAGLAAAISAKKQRPQLDVCVLDKAAQPGNHNLSGAVMEAGPLHELLELAGGDWRDCDQARDLLCRRVENDDTLMLLEKNMFFSLAPAIKTAKLLRLGFGQLDHHGDYILSISRLTRWLCEIAERLGVEVLHGFAVEDIVMGKADGCVRGLKLVDQGRDRQGQAQQNFSPGETLTGNFIVLAEGCDGLVTESFVSRAALQRRRHQLFSVGVKELIEVSDEQYNSFGDGRCVHAMGYPLWTPLLGPSMFGGGIMYAQGDNRIAVGMIVGADWRYRDFNPQDALVRFKEHAFVRRFIDGGAVVEAGAKMIPEGGYYAMPRDPQTRAIGRHNVMIVGDSAGLVNMLKIKGLHNAIASGILAGRAIAETIANPEQAAAKYTELLEASVIDKEMRSARTFRQTVAKFGNSGGFPLSMLGGVLPCFKIEKDYQAMTRIRYYFKCENPFDKDTFIARARSEHREDQPCHCELLDPAICQNRCRERYGCPCISFCPAGVYELIHGELRPANFSNCLHCKTCQNKCPYDNIRWHAPEGTGGPRYQNM